MTDPTARPAFDGGWYPKPVADFDASLHTFAMLVERVRLVQNHAAHHRCTRIGDAEDHGYAEACQDFLNLLSGIDPEYRMEPPRAEEPALPAAEPRIFTRAEVELAIAAVRAAKDRGPIYFGYDDIVLAALSAIGKVEGHAPGEDGR